MPVLGAVSLQVELDFSTLDGQLESLDGRKTKPIKLGLDTQDIQRQFQALNRPSISLEADLKGIKSQVRDLPNQLDCIKVDLCPDIEDFQKKLKRVERIVDCIPVKLCPDIEELRKEISQLNGHVDPIKIDLSPNIQDFQEKLRRIGRISSIEINADIKIDREAVKNQFIDVGRYAQEGFSQGFSADIGRDAAKSLTDKFKQELDIQSPSRVFREIGKYAIQGLIQGLEVDVNQIKNVVNSIENQFKDANLRINLKIDKDDKSPFNNQLGNPLDQSQKNNNNLVKSIASSVEDGFNKVKPRSGIFDSIFSGIGSIISMPIKQALEGVFLGAGLPLGERIGDGIKSGIQAKFGQSIGSFELVAQKATEKALDAIPQAQQSLVELIKKNPIGSEVVKQIEALQEILLESGIQLSPIKNAQALTTEKERIIASSSAAFDSQQVDYKSTKKAKAVISNDFIESIGQKSNIEKIDESIAQQKQQLDKKKEAIAQTKARIKELEGKQAEIQSLPTPDSEAGLQERTSTETSIKNSINEYNKIFASLSDEIERDKKSIQSLEKVKKDYAQKIQKQIETLAELGVEKEPASGAVELQKLADFFEEQLSAQKTMQEVRDGTKTRANTPEPIRQKKLEKLEANAGTTKADLDKLMSTPDADIKQVEVLKKRAINAKKALDIYKLEISDPAKSIDELSRKLSIANAALAENISLLETNLTQTIPTLFREASQEVIKISNLSEIPSTSANTLQNTKNQPIPISSFIPREQEGLPRLYQDVFKESLKASGVDSISPEMIPRLVVSEKLKPGQIGAYDRNENQIHVSKESYEQIQQGKLNDKDVATLSHEIRHALQFDFGRKNVLTDGAGISLLTPSPEEIRKLAYRIEGSTEMHPAEHRPVVRKLEADAYAFESRSGSQIAGQVKQKKAVEEFESSFGIGGIKSEMAFKDAAKETLQNLGKLNTIAQKFGVDISAELQTAQQELEIIGNTLQPILVKAANVDSLMSHDIENIAQELTSGLAVAIEQVQAIPGRLKQSLLAKRQAATEPQIPVATVEDQIPIVGEDKIPNDSLNFSSQKETRNYIEKNLNAKGVRDLARRMGINTKHANKEYLLNEIQWASATGDTRREVASLIGELTPDKFLSSSEFQPTGKPVAEASKIINELKQSRKALADALKVAKGLDASEREIVLAQIIQEAESQQLVARELSQHQLTGKEGKSLGGTRNQLKSVANQAKQELAALQNFDGSDVGEGLGSNIVSAIGSGMINAQKAPIKVAQTVMASVEQAAKDEAEIQSPSKRWQKIGEFLVRGLILGIEQNEKLALSAIAQLMESVNSVPLGTADQGLLVLMNREIELRNILIQKEKESANAKELFLQAQNEHHAFTTAPSAEVGHRTFSHFIENYHKNVEPAKIAVEPAKIAAFDAQQQVDIARENLEHISAQKRELLSIQKEQVKVPVPPAPWELNPSLLPENSKQRVKIPVPPAPWELNPSLLPENSKQRVKISVPPAPLELNPSLLPENSKQRVKIPVPPAPWELNPSLLPENSKQRVKIPVPPAPWELNPSLLPENGKQRIKIPVPPAPWELNPSLLPENGKQRIKIPVPPAPWELNPSSLKESPSIGGKKQQINKTLQEVFGDILEGLNSRLQKLKTLYKAPKIELSPETIHEVSSGTSHRLNSRLDNFEAKRQIIEDLQLDDERRSSNQNSTGKREVQRQEIRERAKLSAKLNRKYGFEGLPPEILPEISGKSSVEDFSIFREIQDIFKSLGNGVAKRVRQRSKQLALEVESAIIPGLEMSAEQAKQRGSTDEQKQYQKLAKQARIATKGVSKVLESPELTEKQVKQLSRLNEQLEKVYDAIGRPLPSHGFLESFGVEIPGFAKNLFELAKGFIAFQGVFILQDALKRVSVDAFNAYAELDKLKTSLNFASGGSSGGSQSLRFVKQQVHDLKIPLQASIQGFVQLEAAARGSVLAGKDTKDIFQGVSQASTVLSLSSEETGGAIGALSQMISKGTVAAEELRGQIAERIPGAIGIAARSTWSDRN